MIALSVYKSYPQLFILVSIAGIVMAKIIFTRIYIALNSHLYEAKGGRGQKQKIIHRLKRNIDIYIDSYNSGDKESGIYRRAAIQMKRAGFYGKYAPVVYIILQFIMPALIGMFCIINLYPDIITAVLAGLSAAVCVRITVMGARNGMNKEFRCSAYKIYRYMHNQMAAGVSINDTIKSLYLICRDSKLSKPLTILSATYARTLDIRYSLEEFKTYFKLDEINSLCAALEQGVMTGDSAKLLARQEKTMFRQ
ncbi:MAG: hypothetical protein M1308_01695 [Actinobacteria bacterium]|nr:hypothetical protein [Actinomycetota bacterium]